MAKRLTQEDKSELLRCYYAGEKIEAIAARYGVSNSYPSTYAARHAMRVRVKSGGKAGGWIEARRERPLN
jgi:transposase-like protein